MYGKVARIGLMVSAIMLASAAAPVAAQEQPVSISMPSMELGAALDRLALQTGVNILYQPEAVSGQRSATITGAATPEDAVRAALRNTSLEVVRDSTGALIVRAPDPGDSSAPAAPNPPVAAASAPAEAPHASGVETVVVMGTLRATEQQTTPVAVTAIGELNIERAFARDIRGLADQVPNLVVTNIPSYNAAAIGIRGTGTGDIITTVDSAVAVVVDGMVMPHVQSQLLDPFDVQQIEVLRGPQGTLFGKNTTGGVVLIRSKRPELNEFSGKVQVLGGNLGTLETRAAVNIPVIQDVLAFRGVVSYQKSHGYYTNDKISTIYGTPTNPQTPLGLPVNGDGRHMGGRDVFYSKAKFLLSPSDHYEALLTFEYLNDDSPARPVVNETPANGLDRFGVQRNFLFNTIRFPGISQTCPELTQRCIFSTGQSFRDDGLQMERGQRVDAFGVYLNQDFTFEPGTLTIFAGYRTQRERLSGGFAGEAWPSLFDATRNLERDTFQGEARFTSEFDGPFQFTAGAAYFINNLDWRSMNYTGFNNVPRGAGCNVAVPSATPGLCTIPGPGSNNRANYSEVYQDGDALGIYAEFYYNITDSLRLVFGGRYSWEKKTFLKRNGSVLTLAEVEEFGRTSGDGTVGESMPNSRFSLIFGDDNSWDGFTFKAGVDWTIDDDNFVYFTFNQGFKSGSYSETCTSLGSCAPFNEETADSWEVGYKGDLFDNTLRFNAVGFYTLIHDVVRSQVVPILDQFGLPSQETQFRNIAGQRNYGIELEATWQPVDELRISANASWLHAEYTSLITDVNGAASIANVLRPECFNIDALGNDDGVCMGIKPNFAPEWKLGANLSYTHGLGNAGDLVFFASVQWQPEYQFNLFNADFTQVQERTLVDLSLTYRDASERYQVVLFVKNLLDETYRVAGNSVAGLFNFTAYGEPRRFGAELTVQF
ncbi:MAG: TonB-dependent receptor [Sphingomonadales bacterium]